MPVQKYSKDQIDAILAAAREGLTPKQVEARVGVSWMTCRYYMKKAGLHEDKKPVVDEVKKAEILRRADAGEKWTDIAKTLDLDRGLVRFHLMAAGLFQKVGPARKYTSEQKADVLVLRHAGKTVSEIEKATGVDEGSVRLHLGTEGVRLTPEQRSAVLRTTVTPAKAVEIQDLRRIGKTREAISEETGVPIPALKTHLLRTDDVLPIEVRTANSQGGKKAFYEKYEHETFGGIVRSRHGRLIGNYAGSAGKVEVECEDGHSFFTQPYRVVQGQWCPSCACISSRGEREIFAFVSALCPDTEARNRTILGGKEFDVFVPSVRFGIEYDGLYWHSEKAPGFKRNASRDKARLARLAGVKYLAVFEDEWRDRRPLLEAMIRLRLGKFEGEKLNARQLELVRLPKNDDHVLFFERSHLAGHTMARYAYGLSWRGKLVSVASVRTDRNGDAELARFATDPDCLVRGGAQRLLSAIRAEETGPLVSYSDNRLSTGDVYQKAGFVEETLSDAPNYYYTDFKTRIGRYRCRRNNDPAILSMFPTEEAQAHGGVFSEKIFGDRRPLYRIEDAGHRRWVLRP